MTSPANDAVEQGFVRDKQGYWTMREELLAKYAGKWVAVHRGEGIVAVGNDLWLKHEEYFTHYGNPTH